MKHSMIAHLSRKTPCNISEYGKNIDSFILLQELGEIHSKNKLPICEYCLHQYSCSTSLSRHRKTCQERNKQQSIGENVNAHGQENMDYISTNFLSNCIMNITESGIPMLVKTIYLNSEHPENHNIRGISMRQGLMETNSDNKWIKISASTALDNLMQQACKVLYRHFTKMQFDNIDLQDIIERNIRIISDMTKIRRSEMYYKIRKNILILFFQNK